MSDMVGADVSALRQFATSFDERRHSIESTVASLTAIIEQLNWVGADRDRFVHDWQSVHRPRLFDMIEDLADSATRARTFAARQENASQ